MSVLVQQCIPQNKTDQADNEEGRNRKVSKDTGLLESLNKPSEFEDRVGRRLGLGYLGGVSNNSESVLRQAGPRNFLRDIIYA